MALYNGATFLREAIDSVIAQTYRDFELIVVDDSSTDESLSILESYSDPRIRIIKHHSNAGAALSRNDALSIALGEFVAIFDADDICASTRLERQVSFLDANPTVGLVGCGVYNNIDVSGAVLYTSYLPENNETIQRTLLERWCFLHPSIMFRKAIQETVGGYRKVFEPAEDHDFILRILEHCKAHNLSEGLVRYRLNPSGLSVVGHQYINELGQAAIRLAKRRRRGQAEDLDAEMGCLLDLKGRRKSYHGLSGALQRWRDSLYAADRYYGFGCRELCVGQYGPSRRCFARSLRTNGLFLKSWIGIVLTFVPFAATRLRFVYRSSMRHSNSRSEPQCSENPVQGRQIGVVTASSRK